MTALQSPEVWQLHTYCDANGSLQLLHSHFPIQDGATVVLDLGNAQSASDPHFRSAAWLLSPAARVLVLGTCTSLVNHFVVTLRWYGIEAQHSDPMDAPSEHKSMHTTAHSPQVAIVDDALEVQETVSGSRALIDLGRAETLTRHQCERVTKAVLAASHIDIARGTWEARTALAKFLALQGIEHIATDPRRHLGEPPMRWHVADPEPPTLETLVEPE